MCNLLSFQCHHPSPALIALSICVLFLLVFLPFEFRFPEVFCLLHYFVSTCVVPICYIIPRLGTSLGSSAPHISLQLCITLKRFCNWCVSETGGSWLTLELVLLVVTSFNTLIIPSLVSLLSFFALIRLLITLLHVGFFYKLQIITRFVVVHLCYSVIMFACRARGRNWSNGRIQEKLHLDFNLSKFNQGWLFHLNYPIINVYISNFRYSVM